MPNLRVTITNAAGAITGEYVIECLDRPGLDTERYDSLYTINLIRAAAERHKYLDDFPYVQALSSISVSLNLETPERVAHLQNVNELWFEVENLLSGARLNFATARILKELEDAHGNDTQFDVNARFDLHLEKMERFHLAVFELARVEDLFVRIVYEYFGSGFIEADTSRLGWEKRLTWDAMKDSLNRRGHPERNPHPLLEHMPENDYQALMAVVRGYRTAEVLRLMDYRNRRTHRVSPSVDHPELSVDVVEPTHSTLGIPRQATSAEFSFINLYSDAKAVYSHMIEMLLRANAIVHA